MERKAMEQEEIESMVVRNPTVKSVKLRKRLLLGTTGEE
jgi:hypothetical protein